MDDLLRMLSSEGAGWTRGGLEGALKAAGVLAGAALLAIALKRRAAASRHLAWSLGLAGALAVLPLALALPHWGLPVLSQAASVPTAPPSQPFDDLPATVPATVAKTIEMPAGTGTAVSPLAPATPVAVAPLSRMSCVPWPLMVWGAGTAAVLAWCAAGWVTIRRLGRTARPVTEGPWLDAARDVAGRLGLAGGVTLLRGGPAAMPLTWGIFRPVLLLPDEADAWPDERRRAVLLHELAHVRRRDCLTQWLGLAACAVYWFNPLAWLAASRLRSERELACDDLVLAAGERPAEYASQLLVVARSLRPAPALAPAALAMARPSGLETRLRAILDARRSRRAPARWQMALSAVAVLSASATIAAVHLVAREEPGPVVEGVVLGPDGKPAEGAAVVLIAENPPVRRMRDDRPRTDVLGRSRTDAQGRYHINVAGDRVPSEGSLLLVAAARGTGASARALSDLEEPVAEPLRLEPEERMEVRVVDLEGAPLSVAAVRLTYVYPSSGGQALHSGILTGNLTPELTGEWTTDADGRFTLRGIGATQLLSFEVRAAGLGNQRVQLQTKGGQRNATLALGRAHIVEGRVTLGKGGPPAVGAHVRASSWSSAQGIGAGLGHSEATVDADGRYRIEAAPGGSIRLEVDPPREGADAYLSRGDLVVPKETTTSRVDFALPRGVLVRGRVTEAGTGRAVVGAIVSHEAHEKNNPYYIENYANWYNVGDKSATTAADGSFRLGVMPGPGYLLVKGPTDDYLHEEISGIELAGQLIWPNTRHYPDALRKLNPKPDDGPLELELTLRRGTTVTGRLVDPGGRPARDAVIVTRWYVDRSQMTINHGQPVLRTRGGRFELKGCDPGSSAPVLFLDPKTQCGKVLEVSGRQAGEDLEIKLEPCGSATVRLVDGQGKPLRAGRRAAHLEVVLTPGASFADVIRGSANDRTASPLMADSIIVDNLDRVRYRGGLRTDQHGRVTFPTLIPGAPYRIYVHNQPVKTLIEFTVKPGEAKDLGDLVIRNVEQAG